MLSDACAAAGTPLVSGAALGFEGQLTVLCGARRHGPAAPAAPCYRCLFPEAPSGAKRCEDAGVLGPVPGVIGVLQAVEAIKLITGVGEPFRGRMLLYDALAASPFYTAQLPPPREDCAACGAAPDAALTAEALGRYDYAAFVQGCDTAAAPAAEQPRISARDYAAMVASGAPHLLLDVRPAHLFHAAALSGAVSLPMPPALSPAAFAAAFGQAFPHAARPSTVVLLCRRGNASRRAAAALAEAGVAGLCDVIGGLAAWKADVDATFPYA